MSIYATLWDLKVPRRHCFDEEWVTVTAQAVPGHIGHPSDYPDGDPYADFLPPALTNYDPNSDAPAYRAVVIIQEGRDKKDVQRYIDPLLVLSGEEYARIPFAELLDRIHKAIGWDDRVIGTYTSASGTKTILRSHERPGNGD